MVAAAGGELWCALRLEGEEVRGSRSIEEEPHQGQRSSRKSTHQRCFDEIPVGNGESDDEVGQMASLENKEGVGCFSGRKRLCAEQSGGEHRWRLYAEGERGMEGGGSCTPLREKGGGGPVRARRVERKGGLGCGIKQWWCTPDNGPAAVLMSNAEQGIGSPNKWGWGC
jgi:hypothetical protein